MEEIRSLPTWPDSVADKLRRAELLLQGSGGQATAEIALLLAEAESTLLRQEDPPRDFLRALATLRISAAEDL